MALRRISEGLFWLAARCFLALINRFQPEPPLSAQQNIHDAFESRKNELHTRLKALLGVDYVVDVDVRAVWPYVQYRSRRDFGTLLWLHVEGFISALQKFIARYGEPGIICFNSAVTQRKITLSPNPFGRCSDTISTAIRDGVFHILFHPDRFGSAAVVPSAHHSAGSIKHIVDRIQLSMNVLGGGSLVPVQRSGKLNTERDEKHSD
ncbi:hypothetical protein C8F01DRAFT_99318 [Mycena amicta]|nr:hypothetical protein C8F01DRAFT_99318 [Mycena amicta]